METKQKGIGTLLERAEEYGKISYELGKLKLVNKVSEVLSMIITHFLLIVIASFFVFAFSTAIALWLGELLGKTYLGFAFVSFFYGLLFFLLYVLNPRIRTRINNIVVSNLLK